MNTQVVSKARVAAHGEVYTHEREVGAMLDMVKGETERIDSRFLEPACGHGNFLAEILQRKLRVVNARYGKNQLDWERNAVLAISSVYGIELLEDNVLACRVRLLQIFETEYEARFGATAQRACNQAVSYILSCNIVWGDALSFQTKEYKNKRKQIQEKLIKFATRIPVFMFLTDYREHTLKDVITQLEPGLFQRVTGLDVKDFELLVSLNVFNSALMNDAVYKFKRYEDSSLNYAGIWKHEGEAVGLFDTTVSADEFEALSP